MSLFQKNLAEYVRFAGSFLALIAVVGLARLGLSVLGQPDSIVRWPSTTVGVYLASFVLSVRVHTAGFGSYRHLLLLLFLVSMTANTISAVS